jgi:hypothetical protein
MLGPRVALRLRLIQGDIGMSKDPHDHREQPRQAGSQEQQQKPGAGPQQGDTATGRERPGERNRTRQQSQSGIGSTVGQPKDSAQDQPQTRRTSGGPDSARNSQSPSEESIVGEGTGAFKERP